MIKLIINQNLFMGLISLIISLFTSYTLASEYTPAPLIILSSELSHHVLIAEKSTHTLYLYKHSQNGPELVKKFTMVTGKASGDKQLQGDYKTPEGIFTLYKFIPHTELVRMYGEETGSIYGSGAFTLNYPNTMDRKESKTGGGIWLHSTNDPSRLDKGLDSRGCLVIANDELKEVSSYLELRKTPIIVTHKLNFLSAKTKRKVQDEVNSFLKSWLDSWQNENLKNYLSHYSLKFQNRHRGNYQRFAAHKKNVFSQPGSPTIKITHVTALQTQKYLRISFVQDYNSKTIQDVGRKELYLKYDKNYNLKIVDELWLKNGAPIAQEPFEPKSQYFTIENQGNF